MNILDATADFSQRNMPLLEKSRYSYKQLGLQLPIKDNGEQLVAIQESEKLKLDPFWNTAGDLEGDTYTSYIADNPDFTLMVRESVAAQLHTAVQLLPAEWVLIVKAGFRPLQVQRDLLVALKNQIQVEQPCLSENEALQKAQRFVADPKLVCPPHCTGAAIDIDVTTFSGDKIDMGCEPNTEGEIAFTHSDLLDLKQKQNREILLSSMLRGGFANVAHEWWHFSYGDQYWAAFLGKNHALYNIYPEEKV